MRIGTGPPTPLDRRRSTAPQWAARLGLVIWLLVLVVLPSIVPEPGLASGPGLSPRKAVGALAQAAVRVLGLVALHALAFVPLGLLAIYSLPARARRLERLVRVTLPACFLGFAATVLARGLTATGEWVAPGVLALALPVAGMLFGLWLGSAWRRGPAARAWILPKLSLAAALAVALGLVLARRAVETSPLPLDVPQPTTADRLHFSSLFRGKNPEKIPPGETRTLRMSEDEANRLLAMATAVAGERRIARVELSPDRVRVAASLALPGHAFGPRFLNLQAAGRVVVDDGALRLDLAELSVGRVRVPRWLLPFASPLTTAILRSEPRLAPTLGALRAVEVADRAFEIRYGHTTLPRGFLRDLVRETAGRQDLLPSVRAQAENLVRVAPGLPRGERRFGAALEAAFVLAHERSKSGSKVEENTAAIIALGTLLGHWRVQSLVGTALDDATLQAGLRAYRETTLRGRRDWVQHYLVSAALAAVADTGVSQATGVLKEELDSRGGSGFSFGDLLADRSGTAFGSVATRDETSAEAIQDHLAHGFRIDDFFPRADDLPENLPEPELQARFGGVGGERYRRIVGIIDSRVAACVAYRF